MVAQNDFQFIPIERVKNELTKELSGVQSSSDTLSIYRSFITRLVHRGNYQEADSLFSLCMPRFIALDDEQILAEIYKERAFMYKVQKRFIKALNDYLWLKSYYEEREDINALVDTYSAMAEFYRAYRNFELMKKHLDLAEDIIKKEKVNKKTRAYWHSRKAAWGTEYLMDVDTIEYHALEGLRLAKESNHPYVEALTLNELGFLYFNKKINKDYLSYYNRARRIFFDEERYLDYVDVTNNYVRGIWGVDEPGSMKILEQIVSLQRKNKWFNSLLVSLYSIYQIQLNLGDLDSADETLHEIYKTELAEKDARYQIALSDAALTYEKDLAQKDLEVQEQQTQLAKAEAQNNRLAFIYAAVIALLLLFITFGVIKINRDFKRKNIQLERGKIALEASNGKLTNSLNHQKGLYQELNHRVKNNLSILSSLIYLQGLNEKDPSSQLAFETLRNRVKSMALIHESLYNSDLSEKLDFRLYLDQLIQDLKQSFTDSDTIDTKIISEGYKIEMIQAVPLAMLLNEFFTNSIKHAFDNTEQPMITVETIQGKEETIIEYRDNGCGYEKNNNTYSTLGLRLTTLLTKQLNGSFDDLSNHRGVFYRLVVPHI